MHNARSGSVAARCFNPSGGPPPARAATARSRRGSVCAPAPSAQHCTAGASRPRTASRAGASLALVRTLRGATVLSDCASSSPDRLVLISATVTPRRLKPSQIARYSGQFSMSRHTTSPNSSRSCTAQRANAWQARASAAVGETALPGGERRGFLQALRQQVDQYRQGERAVLVKAGRALERANPGLERRSLVFVALHCHRAGRYVHFGTPRQLL